jgi:Domain of unknown function (DUF4864)
MNSAVRLAIVANCFVLCAGALMVAGFPRDSSANADPGLAAIDEVDFANAYQHVATEAQPSLNLTQVESIIRHDYTAMWHRGRMEFGGVRVSGRTAEVEVLFFARDGQIRPVVYKLVAMNNSWKITSVQRRWFVPRSSLLRGLRA